MFVGLFAFLLTGCLETYTGLYALSLDAKSPEQVEEKYGKGKDIYVEKNRYIYEDKLIKISFPQPTRDISFSIENKIDRSIKIIWDGAAYIDEYNSSHRVMHSGVKFISRDQPQAPSVIVAGAILEELAYPADYAYYESGKYGGWRQNPILPTQKTFIETVAGFTDKVENFSGKTIGILLPLEIETTIYEYTFLFKIISARVAKY